MEDLIRDKAKAAGIAPYTTSVFLVGWAIGGLIFGALGIASAAPGCLRSRYCSTQSAPGSARFRRASSIFPHTAFLLGLALGAFSDWLWRWWRIRVPDRSRARRLDCCNRFLLGGTSQPVSLGWELDCSAARSLLPLGLKTWQAMFLVGAAPAFLCVFIIASLKEPQKWVQAKAAGAKSGIKFGSYSNLLRHPTWSKHAWLGLILCSAGIVGLWGIGNFHPKIVRSIIETDLASANLAPEVLANKKAYWSSVGLLLQNIGGFLGMLSLAKFARSRTRCLR